MGFACYGWYIYYRLLGIYGLCNPGVDMEFKGYKLSGIWGLYINRMMQMILNSCSSEMTLGLRQLNGSDRGQHKKVGRTPLGYGLVGGYRNAVIVPGAKPCVIEAIGD